MNTLEELKKRRAAYAEAHNAAEAKRKEERDTRQKMFEKLMTEVRKIKHIEIEFDGQFYGNDGHAFVVRHLIIVEDQRLCLDAHNGKFLIADACETYINVRTNDTTVRSLELQEAVSEIIDFIVPLMTNDYAGNQ